VVLADSGVMAAEIDRILLVGGSTRMPMIRRDIEAYLHTEPSKAVNPDYAVAEGAAIQAGIIEGSLSREEGIIMTDVNPYTLGIRVLCDDKSHYMSIVIPRNVTIPVVRKSIYYTSYDNQDAAKIEVYQGEHDDVRLNHFLGEFVISGIPMRPEGEERIEVEFSYNLNGMLEVSARIPSSGEEASVEINMMEYEQEFFTEAATDVTKWKESSLAKEYRTVIRRAERRLKNEKVQNMPFYKDDLESCLYDLKLALIEEDQDRAEELEEDILDMLEEME
jgi:molecular chaperone DnaK